MRRFVFTAPLCALILLVAPVNAGAEQLHLNCTMTQTTCSANLVGCTVGSTWHSTLQIDTVGHTVLAGNFPQQQATFRDASIAWNYGTSYQMSLDRSTLIFTFQLLQTSLNGTVLESDSQGPCVSS